MAAYKKKPPNTVYRLKYLNMANRIARAEPGEAIECTKEEMEIWRDVMNDIEKGLFKSFEMATN